MRLKTLLRRTCLVSVFGAVIWISGPLAGSLPGFAGPQDEVEEFDEEQDFGGWAVILLDEVLNVPNRAARDHLLRAGFAAGPRIQPQLEKALEDDRTAEFAAQLLAFMGNNRALRTLQRLVDDPRDLGLKRFFYGALGEFNTPGTRQTLLDVVAQADDEPDPTVTELAILALTVLADPSLIPSLEEVRGRTVDPVIRDDIENAIEVIRFRANHLEKVRTEAKGDVTVAQALEAYFIADLGRVEGQEEEGAASDPSSSPLNIEIEDLTFAPNSSRALARVRLSNPAAAAIYELVLQKRGPSWVVASVWMVSLQESEHVFQPPPTGLGIAGTPVAVHLSRDSGESLPGTEFETTNTTGPSVTVFEGFDAGTLADLPDVP